MKTYKLRRSFCGLPKGTKFYQSKNEMKYVHYLADVITFSTTVSLPASLVEDSSLWFEKDENE